MSEWERALKANRQGVLRRAKSDLERLTEALAWMGRRSTFLIRGDTKSGARAIRAVFAAARAYRDLLADGERVWWCEVHELGQATWYDPDQCPASEGDCRMVPALLDPTTEEER